MLRLAAWRRSSRPPGSRPAGVLFALTATSTTSPGVAIDDDVRREKCTRCLPQLRVPETLERALMRMAAREDRSLSDYIRLVLHRHVFGHAPSVDPDEEPIE